MTAARSLYPHPRDVPSCRSILDVFNGLPLVLVLMQFDAYPLEYCPRRWCRSPRIRLMQDESVFMCPTCGLMGAGGAYAAAQLWDWGFDQVGAVLQLDIVGREGKAYGR